MKYVLVAAYNRKIGAFMPVQAINDMLDEDIIESNRRAVLNGQIPKEQAEKLAVYKVGVFNDSNGVITSFEEPKFLCDLASFIPQEKTVVEEAKLNGESRQEAC